MFVGIRDLVDIQEPGRDQGTGAVSVRGRLGPQKLHSQAGLLSNLPMSGLLRVFSHIDMPPERQPLSQLAMMDQQNPVCMDDKHSHGEVERVEEMGHVSGARRSPVSALLEERLDRRFQQLRIHRESGSRGNRGRARHGGGCSHGMPGEGLGDLAANLASFGGNAAS